MAVLPKPLLTYTMPLLTYLSLIVTMLFWGGTFIAGRILASDVDPVNSAFLRFAIATVGLFILTLLADGRVPVPSRKKWFPLILLGFTGVFSYNILFFNGLQHINAGRASLIIALNPLVISISAFLFLRESLNRKQLAGILLSLVGAVIVISNGQFDNILSTSIGRGEIAMLGCVISWSAYSLIGRTVLTSLSPLAAVFYSSLIGTLLLLIPAISHDLCNAVPRIRQTGWYSLVYLGLFGTALGFSMYYRAIKIIGAARSGIFINLVPLFSIVLSWLLLGETIKAAVFLGGLVLLCGVTVTNYYRS